MSEPTYKVIYLKQGKLNTTKTIKSLAKYYTRLYTARVFNWYNAKCENS